MLLVRAFHFNNSILHNFDSLQHSLKEMRHEFQTIGFTKILLKSDPDPLLYMPGNNIEFKNRQTQIGRGVMMYNKDSLTYVLRPDLSTSTYSYESLFVEIKPNTKKHYRWFNLQTTWFMPSSFTEELSKQTNFIRIKNLLFNGRF